MKIIRKIIFFILNFFYLKLLSYMYNVISNYILLWYTKKTYIYNVLSEFWFFVKILLLYYRYQYYFGSYMIQKKLSFDRKYAWFFFFWKMQHKLLDGFWLSLGMLTFYLIWISVVDKLFIVALVIISIHLYTTKYWN